MKNPLCCLPFLSGLKEKPLQPNHGSHLPEGLCRQFSLAEIIAATNNFHPHLIIGRGDFGTVYKGTIDDGTVVAVKRRHSKFGGEEFRNESRFLCQLRHPLLVSLIGFCEERNEMILVYEYMSRGRLSDHLYGEGYAPLSWKQRLQICISAARGLHYLHTGTKYAVIHGNVTTRNILLNEEFSCKLHYFGISKLGSFCTSKASRVRRESKIIGTIGYMAPEYAVNGEMTEKTDVFAFGVILFQVLFGRPAEDLSLPQDLRYILEWAKESLREGTIYHAMDPYLKERVAPGCLNKYLEIASRCVHHDRKERPAMGEVEITLELALELQDRADAEMEATNPSTECLYEEALFSASVRNFSAPDRNFAHC
ncbi:hypothetical protein GQ457_06G026920 [Hibiscus cannabinus]